MMRRLAIRFVVTMTALLLFVYPCVGLEVLEGLEDYQVLAVDGQDVARASVSGVAGAAGRVQAQVLGVQKVLVDWQPLGEVEDGAWQGVLQQIPLGGPYQIVFRLVSEGGEEVESSRVYGVLAGDIWILAGQSNMQGVGNQLDMEAPDPLVHTFSMAYSWRLAQEPLHTLAESPDKVHFNAEESKRSEKIAAWRDGPKGAGLGLSFAKEMVRATGRPVGLIASAHGGTSMKQWNPNRLDEGGASLYGSMFQQVARVDARVRGVLWYQGESDAVPDEATHFSMRFKAFVNALRSDLKSPELPFYYVQIGHYVGRHFKADLWRKVQLAQLAAESKLGSCGMVTPIDLPLDDAIHVGTAGLKVLGYRLAKLAQRDLFEGTVSAGPRFEGSERRATPYGNQLRVRFSGVNGALCAAGRVTGFSLSEGADGPALPAIFKQEIDPEDPTAVILWVAEWPKDAHLSYGRGLHPYCNVVDEANMALPVFGPVPVP